MSPWHGSLVATGVVRHRRFAPVDHAFSYRTGWLLLDIDQGRDLLERGWWSRWRGPGLLRFHRGDFLAGHPDPAEEARQRVAAVTGCRPAGTVHLLTTCRMAGHAFNPVSFYFCRHGDGRLAGIVAEITNTPWGERFAYALAAAPGEDQQFCFPKAFHVSPFHPMDQEYAWRFRCGPRSLLVHMENRAGGRRVFDATLTLALRPASPARLFRHVLAWPLASLRVLAAIYLQALRLWWKRIPFYEHPVSASC